MYQRLHDQPAYVLHAHPWRETSLIVEAFSREHGRLPLVAKGAKRPASPLRGVLMAFQPLSLSWSGRGEVKTLTDAQWCGGQARLAGSALLSAYYLNELLMRLLPREDAHPALFDAYAASLQLLAGGEGVAPILRRFEWCLVREMGYAPTLDVCADTGAAVMPQLHYVLGAERGVLPAPGPQAPDSVPGSVLLAIAQDDFSAADTAAAARGLLRRLLEPHLGEQTLATRRIFMELQQL